MTEARLKTDLWIRAQIRLCDIKFIPAVIARRGDSDAGLVMIKRNRLDGPLKFMPAQRHWMVCRPGWRATGPDPVREDAARAVIDREAGFDPDIWVLEIEDRREVRARRSNHRLIRLPL